MLGDRKASSYAFVEAQICQNKSELRVVKA